MRIWVDPIKLNSFQLTIADINAALEAQTRRSRPGRSAALPAAKGQMLNATVSVQSQLQTTEQFGAIRLKTSPDGALVRLRGRGADRAGRGKLRLQR